MPGFTPFKLNNTIDEAPGTSKIKEGHYLVEVVGCGPSREDEDSAFNWSFKLLKGPDQAGRILRHRAFLAPGNYGEQSLNLLGAILRAAGFDSNSLRGQDGEFPNIAQYGMLVGMAALLNKYVKDKQIHILVADDKTGKYSRVYVAYPPETFAAASNNGTPPADDAAYLAEAEKMFPGAQVV